MEKKKKVLFEKPPILKVGN